MSPLGIGDWYRSGRPRVHSKRRFRGRRATIWCILVTWGGGRGTAGRCFRDHRAADSKQATT